MYKGCTTKSDPVDAHEIDTYEYHDAPSDGITFCQPKDWWHDTLYGHIVTCPEHKQEYLERRSSEQWRDNHIEWKF
jgi:hypothetical protein